MLHARIGRSGHLPLKVVVLFLVLTFNSLHRHVYHFSRQVLELATENISKLTCVTIYCTQIGYNIATTPFAIIFILERS